MVDSSRSAGLEAGIYRSEAASLRFWSTFFEAFERVVVKPLEFIELGDSVVIPHHLRARGRDGLEVDARSTVVLTIRDGPITETRLYRQVAEAFEEVGLEQ